MEPPSEPPRGKGQEQRYDHISTEQSDRLLDIVDGLDQDIDIPLTDLELAEVDNLVLETERLEMDENMLDINNDDLLGDSLDSDAEQIEAISQLSPVNTVRPTKAPLPEQPAHTEIATKPRLDVGAKKQADPYVPKGLLKKKSLPKEEDIVG
ncbi:Uncharacterized protein Rs2_15697 [Raphanus sativus]|nr:Uncharacterized protein Rs2_15697 [Raphanus sativus]